MALKEKARVEIEELRSKGYSDEDIKNFLEDGSSLAEMGYTNTDVVEAMYEIVS